MPSQDDRGPAYTAAVERSEAAFAAVHTVLGEAPRFLDNAGELAALAAALPPQTPLFIADWPRIAAGERPGDGWVSAVVATIATVVERPLTPVRDNAGREHDVLAPGLELGVWLLPGPDAPVPAKPQACGYYARAIEALEDDGPGVSLPAVSALLHHIAGLLSPAADYSPAAYLPDGSHLAGDILAEMRRLRQVADRLAEIAPAADAEEAADDDDYDDMDGTAWR